MRDYMMAQAMARGGLQAGSRLSRLYRNWQARRGLARLRDLSERELKDIGVTRHDLEWALGLPLSENSALALEFRSLRRGRCQIFELARARSASDQRKAA